MSDAVCVRLHTKFWLLNNYCVVPDASVKLNDIICNLKECQSNTSIKYSCGASTLGELVQEIWGKNIVLKRAYLRGTYSNTEQVYKNLCKIQKTTPTNDCSPMSWDQLKSHCPAGWCICSGEESHLVWLRMSETEDTINGCRILRELHFNRTHGQLSVTVKYGSHSVNLLNIGLLPSELFMSKIPTITEMNALLSLVSNAKMCPGFDSAEITKNGMKEVWKISGREVTRLRHKKCKLFCSKASVSLTCSKCMELNRVVNRNRKRRSCSTSDIQKRKRLKTMDRDELIESLKEKQRLQKNAEAREKLLRKKIEEEMLEFDDADSDDFTEMFKLIDKKKLGEDMKILFEEQRKALQQKTSKANRWHPRIIQLALSIYARSPHAYDELSKVLILPSMRTLARKKNKNSQEPGWNYDSIKALMEAAKKKNLKDVDRWGGLCFDEMAIQEDLQLVKCNGISKLVGFVTLGQPFKDMTQLMTGELKPVTATHVLQFVFISDGGFRYPVAHFPTRECPPAILHRVFWEGVRLLLKAGFHVHWSCCDGGESNRGFINLHFKENKTARESHFTTRNPMTGGRMVFIMDPKHNIKKIRNNLEKSTDKGPNTLQVDGRQILWKHWFSAYSMDQSSNSLVIHERLTEDHFHLSAQLKMRNHLAEDVLDRKMLFTMQAYKRHLNKRNGQEVSFLDASIEVLTHTSKLVHLFNDVKNPIRDMSDIRLQDCTNFLTFLDNWYASVEPKHFISRKLYFDMQSLLLGFTKMCEYKLQQFPGSSIMPGIVNQDVVENVFCQARSYNGQNANPSYDKYCKSMNSILIGQKAISKKGNASLTFLK
ncbi:uncharacterized protein [Ptychodera flava]|uniref:uncharacterized protein n=1 Tax=Ptychodera flava TaxID=63121 RepID=UPI00396A7D82